LYEVYNREVEDEKRNNGQRKEAGRQPPPKGVYLCQLI
jgi:hypothetical protein